MEEKYAGAIVYIEAAWLSGRVCYLLPLVSLAMCTGYAGQCGCPLRWAGILRSTLNGASLKA